MGHEKTIVLGSECDDSLRVKLRDVIKQMSGKNLSCDWVVGGSQEIESEQIQIGGETIVVESETYIGISVRGSVMLVDKIRDKIAAL